MGTTSDESRESTNDKSLPLSLPLKLEGGGGCTQSLILNAWKEYLD